MSARFTTTHGPDLKQVSGTVYSGSHNGEEQRILWFKFDDKLYPTVYTLWKNPRIVPLIHTMPNVVEKMQGGADLMIPGLAVGPPFPAKAKKGAVAAVASTDQRSVPMAVGVCEIDVSDLQEVQGIKGHAIENLHWAGDELWAWSPSGKPGADPPQRLDGWLEDDDDMQERTEQLSINPDGEESGGVLLPKEPAEAVDGDTATKEEEIAEEPEKELSTKDIDAAFRNAFLYGVYHYKEKHTDEKNFGLEFPLSQSFVMSNLVQPFLPAFTANQASQLQMKKTSWKNIKKFIRSLDKEMIIKSKERDGNEVVVYDIDFDDRHIANFTPYRLPKKETAIGTSAGRGEKAMGAADAGDSSVGQKLKVQTLYKPKDKLDPMFESTGVFYTASELRPIVEKYIENENLINEKNKRLIELDPFLANNALSVKNAGDKGFLEKGNIPRDALLERIQDNCCSPYYVILRCPPNESEFGSSKPKAGHPPKILITMETRSGNKTVTKVSGLEPFNISPQPLADELRKVCAGSTSVDQLAGSSMRNPVMEVMVQGPQRDAVTKALEKRGVDKRWIDVVDKTKGKKKS